MQSYDPPTNLLIYTNNGDGTFPAATRLTMSATYPTAADVNEDGQPDLVLTSGTSAVAIAINTTNPAPTITNLVPNGGPVGQSQTLVVHGHGFLSRSVINWNGTPLPTSFNYHDGTLTATLRPSLTATSGVNIVTITTQAPGGGTSNTANFYVGNVPTSVEVSPATVSFNIGTLQTFKATVFDQSHVAMPVQPHVTWSTSGKANLSCRVAFSRPARPQARSQLRQLTQA